jgi:hypothetical protein
LEYDKELDSENQKDASEPLVIPPAPKQGTSVKQAQSATQGSSDAPDELKHARRIIYAMLAIVAFGLVLLGWASCVCCRSTSACSACPEAFIDSSKLAARGLILAAACLAAGFLAGFLFGIPKVLQGGRTKPKDGGSDSAPYQQLVNTNLEDISDWLTKIIVGLGLYELKNIPAGVGELARSFASGFHQPDQTCTPLESVFAAAIVFFVICGFLLGYLITRIYLQKALALADRSTSQEEDPGPRKNEDPESITPDVDASISAKKEDPDSATPEVDNAPESNENV